MTEKHGAAEHDVSHYPHFQGDGVVTHDQLAQHMEEHPDLYTSELGALARKILDSRDNEYKADAVHDEDLGPTATVSELLEQFKSWEYTPDYTDEWGTEPKEDLYLNARDAQLLLDSGYSHFLVDHLSIVAGLNNDIAHQLCDRGYQFSVAQNIGSFHGLDSQLVSRFIESGYVDDVLRHLGELYDLDESVADLLVKKGFVEDVVRHVDSFSDLPFEILKEAIDQGHADDFFVRGNVNEGLARQAAEYIFEAGDLEGKIHLLYEIVPYLESLTLEDAKRLAAHSGMGLVVDNLEGAFSSLSPDEVGSLVAEWGNSYMARDFMTKVEHITLETAQAMAKIDLESVIDHLDKMSEADIVTFAKALINDGYAIRTRNTMLRVTREMSPELHREVYMMMLDADPEGTVGAVHAYEGDKREVYERLKQQGHDGLIFRSLTRGLTFDLGLDEIENIFLGYLKEGNQAGLSMVGFFRKYVGTNALSTELVELLKRDRMSVLIPLQFQNCFEQFDISSYLVDVVSIEGVYPRELLAALDRQEGLSGECLAAFVDRFGLELMAGRLSHFADSAEKNTALADIQTLSRTPAYYNVGRDCLGDSIEHDTELAEKMLHWVADDVRLASAILPDLTDKQISTIEELGIAVPLKSCDVTIEHILQAYKQAQENPMLWADMRQLGFLPRESIVQKIEEDFNNQLTGYVRLASMSPESDPLPEYVAVQEELGLGVGDVSLTIDVKNMLLSEGPSDEAKEFGIEAGGKEGVRQLVEKAKELSREYMAVRLSDDQETQLLRSRFARQAFLRTTEISNESGYGYRSEGALQEKLRVMLSAREEGLITPMHEALTESKVYEIKTTASRKEKPEWPEDVLSKYRSLVGELNDAKDVVERRNGFGELTSSLRYKIGDIVQRLDTELEQIDAEDPKAEFKRRNLEQRRSSLEKYLAEAEGGKTDQKRFVVSSPVDFQRGFNVLEKYSELHSDMRTLTFAWAMRKNPDRRNDVSELNTADPSIEDMADVREFIDKIVNGHTFGDYFTDKKTAQRFRQMTSTRSLSEAIIRYNEHVAKPRTTPIQFIPTRGIYMEVSGQIGDACWADEYESNAVKMPNMSALIMKARPGQKNERIVGSAMLIESENSDTGEPVLILRGTNPKENYINKVDVEDFYQAITDYVKDVADKMGRVPSVVIDGHSGGSATNRPVLYGYLASKKWQLDRVPVPDENTNFNGYNIEHQTYRVQ